MALSIPHFFSKGLKETLLKSKNITKNGKDIGLEACLVKNELLTLPLKPASPLPSNSWSTGIMPHIYNEWEI